MKHFIRTETATGLAAVPAAKLPTTVKLVHQGSGQEFTFAAAVERRRPQRADHLEHPARGQARRLRGRRSNGRRRPSAAASAARRGRRRGAAAQLVERQLPRRGVPPAAGRRAPVAAPKAVQVAPTSVAVDVQMSYFSGGADGGAPLRASALLKSRSPSFAGYDEFSFEPPRDPKKAEQRQTSDERGGRCGRARRQARRRQAAPDHRPQRRRELHAQGPAAGRAAEPDRCRGQLRRSERRGADRRDPDRRCGRARWCSACATGSWASSRGRAKFTVARARHRGQADQGPERRRSSGRVSQIISTRKRMVGGFYAYDNRTEVKELGALCTRHDRRPRPAALRGDARGRRPGRADRRRRRTRRPTSGDGRGDGLGHEAGRALVRAGQRRPHRRAAREEALRAGRDRAAAGAHAVPRGDRAGRGRARGRDRDAGGDAARRRPDGRAEDRAGLGPERLRQRAGAARPDPRGAVVLVLHLGLEGSRSSGGGAFAATASDCQAPTAMVDLAKPAFKLGVAKLQVGLAGARAAGERHGRQAAVRGAPDGDGEDQGDAAAASRWPARRSRSPRSTKACWRCAPTTPGTCSRR